jgi:hypothetical protein
MNIFDETDTEDEYESLGDAFIAFNLDNHDSDYNRLTPEAEEDLKQRNIFNPNMEKDIIEKREFKPVIITDNINLKDYNNLTRLSYNFIVDFKKKQNSWSFYSFMRKLATFSGKFPTISKLILLDLFLEIYIYFPLNSKINLLSVSKHKIERHLKILNLKYKFYKFKYQILKFIYTIKLKKIAISRKLQQKSVIFRILLLLKNQLKMRKLLRSKGRSR